MFSKPLCRKSSFTQPIVAIATLFFLLATAPAWATLTHSQVFDSWPSYTTTANVTLSADSANKHEGNVSLKFVNASALAGNVYGGFVQSIPSTPSTLYHFSVWVKASGVATATTNAFIYNSAWTAKTNLPGGTYTWQQVSWDYTTASDQTSIPLILLSQDIGTIWLDQFSVVKDGTTQNLAKNAGFETFVDGVTVTTKELVFAPGSVTIGVDSSAASVGYTVTDTNSEPVQSGSLNTSAGPANLVLNSLPAGYYGLKLAGGSGSRNSSFGVVTGAGTAVSPTNNPFGTTIHPELTTGTDLSGVMGKMGLANARLDLRWDLVEKTQGVYTWDANLDTMVVNMNARGTKPMLILGYYNPFYDSGRTPSTTAGLTGYANFAKAAAQHFGTTADYEVYNEYNYGYSNSVCGQTADCYLPMLQATYNAIKSVQPSARVVGGTVAGLTSWWLDTSGASYLWVKRLADLGGLAYLDVLSIHSYGYPNPPEGQNSAVISRVRTLLNGYAGGSSKPLWLDETGWITIPNTPSGVSEATQADFAVRDAVSSVGAGVNKYMFYDLLDDYPDRTSAESSFGYMRNLTEQGGALAPKPSYVGIAVLSRKLEGYSFLGTESIGSGAYSYKFRNALGAVRRALWAPGTAIVSVAMSGAGTVTLTSHLGVAASLSSEGNKVPLKLTEHPVFLEGTKITAVTAVSTVPFTAAVPSSVLQNRTTAVTVTVNNTGNWSVSTTPVTFRASNGTTVQVASTPNAVTQGVLNIPAFTTLGTKTVTIDVLRSTNLLTRITSTTSVTENPLGVFAPTTVSGGTTSSNSLLKAVYSTPSQLNLSTVNWSVGSLGGSLSPNVPLDASGVAFAALPTAGLDLWKSYPYSVNFTFSDAMSKTIQGNTSFAPIYADGTVNPPTANLLTAGNWVGISGGTTAGAADLSGNMWLSYSSTGITVHATITDDIHSVAATADQLWTGDSIQFAFTTSLPGWGGTAVSYGAALLSTGPVVYKFSGTPGLVTDAVTSIVRDEVNKLTTYSVFLPWADLGGITASDGYFSYSFLVNDNDGAGRKGFTEWGSGIGTLPDATLYLPIQKL